MCSEELHADITQTTLRRSKDSIIPVRVEAVQALARLQDAGDADCEVVQELLRILEAEPNK